MSSDFLVRCRKSLKLIIFIHYAILIASHCDCNETVKGESMGELYSLSVLCLHCLLVRYIIKSYYNEKVVAWFDDLNYSWITIKDNKYTYQLCVEYERRIID